ncbi:MAG: hypothetical protein ACTSP4_05480 [Candidatus Hodarchaeales archaeon]
MVEYRTFPWGGMLYGEELPDGCQRCIKGEKLVIFTTGHCNAGCFYCPISLEKKGIDVFQANERKISSINEVIEEANLSSATSASFTGGDPFLAWKRMVSTGRALKDEFGEKFHVHAYTTGRNCSMTNLEKTGPIIDELRFHPINKEDIKGLERAIELIEVFNWTIGLEVPALKEFHEKKVFIEAVGLLKKSIIEHDNRGFININELEISESNYRKIVKHGYQARQGAESIVEGSKQNAIAGMEKLHEKHPELTLHFCPVAEKDTVQLPNRLYKRAKNIALPSDLIISEGVHRGLLIRGVIRINNPDASEELEDLRNKLIDEFDIPDTMITIDREKKQLLTVADFLETNHEEIREISGSELVIGMVEEYPTVDRLQTSLVEFR